MKLDLRMAGVWRMAITLSAIAAIAGCGRGDKEAERAATKPEEAPPPSVVEKKTPQVEQTYARAVEDAKATATSGKSAAAVDLEYDVLAKPEPGQPFEIELVFVPRLPADALEVEVTPIPGVVLISGGSDRFENVTPASRYSSRVTVSADQPGLYYIGVVARMVTKVETEARAFSVPAVVGTLPAEAKPQPDTDATGQAIQSMPAEETRDDGDATKQPQ